MSDEVKHENTSLLGGIDIGVSCYRYNEVCMDYRLLLCGLCLNAD